MEILSSDFVYTIICKRTQMHTVHLCARNAFVCACMGECACVHTCLKFYESNTKTYMYVCHYSSLGGHMVHGIYKIQGQRQCVSIAQCGAVATATPETSMGESLPSVV